MRPLLAAASLIAFTLACRQSHLGACGSDSDCAPGAQCDTSQETPVCIVPPGGCVPVCTSGQICNGAIAACEPASNLAVKITSPSAGAFGDGVLHATATASAPGGVESLRFELRSHTNSAVLVTAFATTPGASTFAADIPIGGTLVDGPAELRALVTWDGGSGASEPVAVIVDQHPPVISDIAISPAGMTTGTGHVVWAASGAPLTVTAKVTDASGIADGTVCLAADGENGACPHPGTSQGGGTYQFSVPRSDGDGSSAVHFTITASDVAAAALGASHATHAQSPALFFDRRTPSIAAQADTAWYSRTAARAVPVVATITDPYGLAGAPQLVSNGVAHDGVRGDGAAWVFTLDAQDAPAGVQDAYAFQLRATNALGTPGSLTVTRNVDDVQPAVTFQVYRDAKGAGPVTYPPAVANTGWDGTQFVYSDVVHVAGTIRDPAGVSASSVVHVDGRAADGSASWGAVHALGCDGMRTTCTFDVQLPLNEAGKEFHTGSMVKPMGDHLGAPAGTLSVVVTGADAAVDSDGTPAPNARTQATPVQVTRLLWQLQMPFADAVTGLAVHPNGNLIVTTDGNLESVYALRPDAPEIRWECWEPGPIRGEPAIGQGDAASAPIYLAASSGDVFALAPDGTKLWQRSTGETLLVGPAISSVGGFEQVIVPGGDAAKHNLYGVTQGALASASMTAEDVRSSPLILGRAIYYGTSSTFERRGLSSAGAFASGAPAQPQDPPIVTFFDVMTDGVNLFTWRDTGTGVTTRGIASYDAALNFRWRAQVTPSGGFTTAAEGSLIVPLKTGPVATFPTDAPKNVTELTPGTLVASLGNTGHAALVGSGGHVYFARDVAQTVAYTGDGTLSYLADPDGTIFPATTMDCQGRLFAASNAADGTHALVYALITDDAGLADAPWPSQRRDSRNTGNAGFARYGSRTGAACIQ